MVTSARELEIATILVRLADSQESGHDVIDTLDLLVQASTAFTSAVEAGILLADANDVLHVVASSSERTSDVEEAQLGTNRGPCVDSFRSGETVEIADLSATKDQWPDFAAVAAERGFRAAHAVPLRLRGQTLGAMNLFSEHTGTLSVRDAALAKAMAQVATIGIVQQQVIQEHVTLTLQLQHALASRVLIEQAKGVLAERHSVPIDGAFALLRNHARDHGARLRDIADQIVNDQLAV